MTIAQWTHSETGEWILDTDIKHEGAGSGRLMASGYGSGTTYSYATRNALSKSQLLIEAYIRFQIIGDVHASGGAGIIHPSYGTLYTHSQSGSGVVDWEKYRLYFWYDSGDNHKYGLVMKWVTDQWEQQGTIADFGLNSPAADTIKLMTRTYRNGTAYRYTKAWWDEVKVYEPSP